MTIHSKALQVIFFLGFGLFLAIEIIDDTRLNLKVISRARPQVATIVQIKRNSMSRDWHYYATVEFVQNGNLVQRRTSRPLAWPVLINVGDKVEIYVTDIDGAQAVLLGGFIELWSSVIVIGLVAIALIYGSVSLILPKSWGRVA